MRFLNSDSVQRFDDIIENINRIGSYVDGVDEGTFLPDCRDPFDRPFLELALVAKADALVTGDKDLLF